MKNRESGFSSIQAMMILLILSLSVLGLGTAISLTQRYNQKNKRKQQDIILLKKEVTDIIKQLKSDPTPESDSPMDPVWSYMESRSNKYENLELTDVSSRINPNWVRPVFFERTDFKRFLLKGVSSDMLKDHRHETGFVIDIYLSYSDLIDPEALKKFFTPYSYLNVNTAYEYVLKDMYENLTGNSAGAADFHTFIERALSEKHIINEEEFIKTIGSDYKDVYPVISTLPEMNVNFIHEFILEQVLAYPYGGEVIEDKIGILNNLLALRNSKEITTEDLHDLIKTEGLQERIFHHLGTKTWFWRLEIATKGSAVEAIIVCMPADRTHHSENVIGHEYSYGLYSFSSKTRE